MAPIDEKYFLRLVRKTFLSRTILVHKKKIKLLKAFEITDRVETFSCTQTRIQLISAHFYFSTVYSNANIVNHFVCHARFILFAHCNTLTTTILCSKVVGFDRTPHSAFDLLATLIYLLFLLLYTRIERYCRKENFF